MDLEQTQEQQLTEKLKELGYPDFDIMPGQEEVFNGVLMLYIQDKPICSVNYALSMSDAQLKALIDETVAAGQVE